jgi:hypothetical protein
LRDGHFLLNLSVTPKWCALLNGATLIGDMVIDFPIGLSLGDDPAPAKTGFHMHVFPRDGWDRQAAVNWGLWLDLNNQGEDFRPPTGRGLPRLVSDEHTGRCPAWGRAWPRRADGTLIARAGRAGDRCEGSGQAPAEDLAVASWLPDGPRDARNARRLRAREPGHARHPQSRPASALGGFAM